MFIMYVSVFLQTYQNVCRLKQYFTYKYLPKRFITSDNHKKKSLMGTLHVLSINTGFGTSPLDFFSQFQSTNECTVVC